MHELDAYRTLYCPAQAEITAKKSRFIASVAPADSEAGALGHVAAVRGQHRDATHNVYAYRVGLGPEVHRYSDDGEPNGTAGVPVLEVLKKEGLRNVVVVVTRYFGGTLLGAGGLIRAYGKAAAEGIRAAGVVQMLRHRELSVVLDYPHLGKVENEIRALGQVVGEIRYGVRVEITVYCRPQAEDELVSRLMDLTGGRLEVRRYGWEYLAENNGVCWKPR